MRVTGSTPFEQVLIDPGRQPDDVVEVQGEYTAELRNLLGAIVRASGVLSTANRLEVTSYEVLEIVGQVPVVGLLEIVDGRAILRSGSGEPVQLHAVPAVLRAHNGAKVWVVLDSTGAVKAYGIIRER
ncbi:MAG: hypothetical protein JSV86_19985 [Gemmatimonadota bacterium]|nr:MAG: hypothetical protein JSV86_19985 [Gemmatimonadota bacterium]